MLFSALTVIAIVLAVTSLKSRSPGRELERAISTILQDGGFEISSVAYREHWNSEGDKWTTRSFIGTAKSEEEAEAIRAALRRGCPECYFEFTRGAGDFRPGYEVYIVEPIDENRNIVQVSFIYDDLGEGVWGQPTRSRLSVIRKKERSMIGLLR